MLLVPWVASHQGAADAWGQWSKIAGGIQKNLAAEIFRWLKNHPEIYEFVNGKDDIPYIMENKKCSKPPTSSEYCGSWVRICSVWEQTSNARRALKNWTEGKERTSADSPSSTIINWTIFQPRGPIVCELSTALDVHIPLKNGMGQAENHWKPTYQHGTH